MSGSSKRDASSPIVLNRTMLDSNHQEVSPTNQSDDLIKSSANLLKGKAVSERKKSIFSLKISRGSKSKSLGNEESLKIIPVDVKNLETGKIKNVEKEQRKLSTKSFDGDENKLIKKTKKHLFSKRQSMYEGVCSNTKESVRKDSLKMPAIPNFDMSGLHEQPDQSSSSQFNTSVGLAQSAFKSPSRTSNNVSQPIASKLPLSNINNSQQEIQQSSTSSIHNNLVNHLAQKSVATGGSSNGMKNPAINRANTNDSFLNPNNLPKKTDGVSETTLSTHTLSLDETSNTERQSSTSNSNINQSSSSIDNSPTENNSVNTNKSKDASTADPPTNNGYFAGYLLKWTNYIKGYQKRWFVLNNGLLSYFRSQAEMAHTCRGTINLCNAIIQSEDTLHFVVTNGNQQTFHLKASNEMEKQKWVSALELAKNKSKQYTTSNSGNIQMTIGASRSNQQDSDDDENSIEAEKTELANMLKMLQQKLDDLSTSHEFVLKHSSALTKNLTELESIQSKPDEMIIKTIKERSTVYKITMLAVINACQDFINLSKVQTQKMHKVLQSEREMRTKLEDMVQEMATKQLNFETQLKKRSKRNNTLGKGPSDNSSQKNQSISTSNSLSTKLSQAGAQDPSGQTDSTRQQFQINEENEASEDDDLDDFHDEFHDAVEDVCQFSVTLPRHNNNNYQMHHRNASNISKLYLKESDSSEDEQDQYIQVTMHSQKEQDQVDNSSTLAVEKKTPPKVQTLSTDINSLKQVELQAKTRRNKILPRPNASLNLWSIMKNCIGKDLSKIPLPVNFSEPLSMLQRVTEELEYSDILDAAAQCDNQWEQMAYIAAFTVSAYCTTANRTNKPFNPLLGETFECDRLDDFGWRSLSEQVSHHPPGFATHVESLRDWTFFQEFTMSSKFRGQYLQVIPLGTSHIEFKRSGNHYTWRKVATFVRNIIVGKLWIDNVGEMDIINHKTKDVCHLKYFAYSYFSREPPRKVTGIITDSNNIARYVLNGTWTDQIEGAPVLNPQVVTEQTQLNTGKSKILWRKRNPPAHLETMYNFTQLAVQLNEPEDGVAPTDSRLRPDQRAMEENKWDKANEEKLRLEELQRERRHAKRKESIQTTNASEADSEQVEEEHEPIWFQKAHDPYTNQPIYVCNNMYWECKKKQDWIKCPNLF